MWTSDVRTVFCLAAQDFYFSRFTAGIYRGVQQISSICNLSQLTYFSTLVNKVCWPSGIPRFTSSQLVKNCTLERHRPPEQTLSWGLLKINSFNLVTGAVLDWCFSASRWTEFMNKPSFHAKSQPHVNPIECGQEISSLTRDLQAAFMFPCWEHKCRPRSFH